MLIPIKMVIPGELESPTATFAGLSSIQLSYGTFKILPRIIEHHWHLGLASDTFELVAGAFA